MDAYAARKLKGHSPQGQTLPLYLACRVGDADVVYQTKLAGRRSGLSPRELGVEMLGTTLAHEAGLHVARPAMVTLTPTVVEAVEASYDFRVDDATAFGTVWKAGLTPFLADVELGALHEAECAILLALDLILTNGDRTEPNPNVCWDGDRLLVFDFEHCLELPRLSLERRYALHLQTLGPTLATHLVAPRVGKEALQEATLNVLEGLNVESLERDSFALSKAWREEWLENVRYLGYVKSEPEALLDRIRELRP